MIQEKLPEDQVYIEEIISGMLSRYLDLVLKEGEESAREKYTHYFYRMFNEEYRNEIRQSKD